MRRALGGPPVLIDDEVTKNYVDQLAVARYRNAGTWSAYNGYAVNDVVSYNNMAWVCTSLVPTPAASAYVGAGTYSTTDGTSTTGQLKLPAAAQAGDVGVWAIQFSVTTATPTTPTFPVGVVPQDTYNVFIQTNLYHVSGYAIYTITSADIAAGYLAIPTQAVNAQAVASTLMLWRNVTVPSPKVSSKHTASNISTPITPNGPSWVAYVVALQLQGGTTTTLTQANLSQLAYSTVTGLTLGVNEVLGVGYESGTSGTATTARTFTTSMAQSSGGKVVYAFQLNTGSGSANLAPTTDTARWTPLFDPLPATANWRKLTGPVVVAHRGGALHVPEHTMEGYMTAISQGAHVIEQDLTQMADGAFAVIHDPTLTRTTQSTGNVADMTAASWKQLRIDAGDYIGGGWRNDIVPLTWDDVLREFGNRYRLCPEVKTAGTGPAVLATLQKYSIDPRSIVVQSFNATDLDPFVAAGYDTMWLGSTDFVTASAKGYTYLAPAWNDAGLSATMVNTAHIYGLKVMPYTIQRRYQRDQVLGLGVDGYFADDPGYLKDDALLRKTDAFKSGMTYPGHQADTSNFTTGYNGDHGIFFQGGYWGYSQTSSTATTGRALIGYLRPTSATAFTLTFTANIWDAINTGRWLGVFIGTEQPFLDTGVAETGSIGYHFLIRQSGVLDIFYVASGAAAVSIGTITGTALTAGTDYAFTITVTATTVSIKNNTLGTTVSATHSATRGSSVHLGQNGASGGYKGVTIT